MIFVLCIAQSREVSAQVADKTDDAPKPAGRDTVGGSSKGKPADRYTISVITMSPGDPVFFRFGHNAILVRDSVRGTHKVYNWGTFSFDEPGLVAKFLQGRLTYWLSVPPLLSTLQHYDSEHRWVVEQELAVTSQQARRLVQMLDDNAKPENRRYRYHYYRDNCSTRVRDAVDDVLDGKLRAVSEGPARLTYRGQTSRLVADVWWGYAFLNLAMGSYIDVPVTEWEEMFVPERVQEQLRKVQVEDASGNMVALVRSERMLVSAPNRAAPPHDPPNRVLPHALVGALVGALLGWLGYRLVSHRDVDGGGGGKVKIPLGRRLALGIPLGALTILTGFLGLLFVFFWTLTDHEVAYHNENLLQTSPLTAAFPVIAVGIMMGRLWAIRAYRWVAYAVAVLSVLGLLLKILPWFDQVNGDSIALCMPVWLGIAAGPLAHEILTRRRLQP